MSFWSKTRKSASRTKQSALAKVGTSEETVDAGFNYEKERFKEYYTQVKKVEENSERMMKAMKEFTAAQNALIESVSAVFNKDSSLHAAALDAKGAAAEIDNARTVLEESIDVNILKPIVRYKMQFKEMKTRMESWDTKRLDLDRYRHDVKGYQKSGKELKEKAATEKLDLATHNFDIMNEEIQQDLTKLYNDRLIFFQPIFAALLVSSLEFYIGSTGAVSKTASDLGRIDRTAALNHAFVITPREDSAAYKISSKSFAPRGTLRSSIEGKQTTISTFQAENGNGNNAGSKGQAIQPITPTPFDNLPNPVIGMSQEDLLWFPKTASKYPPLPPPPAESLPSL